MKNTFYANNAHTAHKLEDCGNGFRDLWTEFDEMIEPGCTSFGSLLYLIVESSLVIAGLAYYTTPQELRILAIPLFVATQLLVTWRAVTCYRSKGSSMSGRTDCE